jgi:uncharacterized membrane protein HdeD (DUF308 family)
LISDVLFELEMTMGNWIILVVLGLLSIIAGFLAILNPFPASLVAVKLAAWSFLVIGALQIIEVFRATGWGGRLWLLAIGIIAVLAGIDLLGEPLSGMISLTIVLAILFVISGILKILAAFQVKNSKYRLAVQISGLVSILIGFMIFSNFPVSALTSLGILLGVELISDGISAISLGLARKSTTS